ncbi:hypothetical protein PVK06_011996 [Gossypium arboreum]|uniref:Uncharacterized protein n=1 Tax=Gossypium arboreum TaxID=29729 RepID=A0ABR0QAZ6_GOSAR|nr:hypothetical protein PVK06_011996 [Gossypium arboreum]
MSSGSTVRYSTGFFVDDFEGDVKSVIQKYESNNPDRLEICAIIYNIYKLKRFSIAISFRHVYKSANYLDHFLASGNLKLGQETYLLGGVPDSIADAVKRRHLREPD